MQFYTVTIQTILTPSSREYANVFCIDRFTNSSLDRHLERVVPLKLSPFDTNYKACGPIVFTKSHCSEWLEPRELPVLFSLIMSNGFTINDSYTKIAQKSGVDFEGSLVCMISRV